MRLRLLFVSLSMVMLSAITGGASAASLSLNFGASAGGINDKDAEGTGFTTRLTGTGGALLPNDANLDLDTGAGLLHLSSTDSDINGQVNLPVIEFLGVNLSSLGFTGVEDFRVKAAFKGIPGNPTLVSFDQFGIYAGINSATHTESSVINFTFFGGHNEFLGRNIIGGFESNGNFNNTQTPTGDLVFEISRKAGVWNAQLTGASLPGTIVRNPTVSPGTAPGLNLNAQGDLTVGVYLSSAFNPPPFTPFVIDLDSFEVTVVPEPTSIALLGIAVAGLFCGRRRLCQAGSKFKRDNRIAAIGAILRS